MFDESFFVALAFLLVIGYAVYLGVPRRLLEFLDNRSAEIASEIDRAKALRIEAEKLLAEQKRRYAEAEREAEDIVKQAETNATTMAEEAKQAMAQRLKQREAQATQKIARAETEMLREIREAIIAQAIATTSALLEDKITPEQAAQIADAVIADIDTDIGKPLH